jgi:2,3-diaminopropionate biosynthesis protein SbnB
VGENGILILGAGEIADLLAGQEEELIETVGRAYVTHGRGESTLPHSSFLRFPGDDLNRIIALPAFLGGEFGVAGIKWISSFPGNLQRGLERASAVLVLNSCETGRPEAILESSLISARRTAASAALAARILHRGAPAAVGLIGTGLINREVLRFLRVTLPDLGKVVVYDLDRDRAAAFVDQVRPLLGKAGSEIAPDIPSVLRGCPLVSFATTAIRPHVGDLSLCPPGATILHVSLRDLTPQAILACDNVVDDPDHVSRAQTSIHLAEQLTGGRDFIRATLAQILEGTAPARPEADRVTVFSPFGLGVLDIAVGKLVAERALAAGKGTRIDSFLPAPAPAR